MLLLGGAVFFLTVALVEANPFDGHLALWLSLMQGAILLGAAFIFWERRAPSPMITPALIANKQFRNANLGMLLFGAGAIGSLLLLSLVFMNLWGYEPIEAALALVPVPLCGLIVWPFVGRAADKRAPGDIAKPALNVGAMGAVAGPEVGLASGILNTARQLGAAIGVAILVATFGGVLHAHMDWFAEDEIEDVVDDWDMPAPMANEVIQSTLHDYTGGTQDRFEPKPGFDEEIIRQTARSARQGYAWAFRQAAILVLSVLPLLGALRRTPAQAQAEFMARMKAQQRG